MTFLVDGTNGGTFPSWTTATRPASPAVGQMGYNTTTGKFDQYTAGGWSSVATAGTVLQTVSASSTTQVTTTSTSPVSSGIAVSITPQSSSNKILIIVHSGAVYMNTTGQAAYLTVYRNSTNLGSNYLAQVYSGLSTTAGTAAMNYLDSPATTSSTTYTVYYFSSSGAATAYLNNGGMTTITVMEIAA